MKIASQRYLYDKGGQFQKHYILQAGTKKTEVGVSSKQTVTVQLS